jgi:hypothetical protein
MNATRGRKRVLVVGRLKPRNPLVVPARSRKAGEHRPDPRAERRKARLQLRKEDPDS